LIGENDVAPIVDFIHGTPGQITVVQPGDRVVTSGKDGLLPPHLPVGTVVKVEGDRATIELATNFNRISYVRVLEYASPFGVIPAGKGPPVLNPHETQVSVGAETTGATNAGHTR
jgi:rod shape-determining protein MreC